MVQKLPNNMRDKVYKVFGIWMKVWMMIESEKWFMKSIRGFWSLPRLEKIKIFRNYKRVKKKEEFEHKLYGIGQVLMEIQK